MVTQPQLSFFDGSVRGKPTFVKSIKHFTHSFRRQLIYRFQVEQPVPVDGEIEDVVLAIAIGGAEQMTHVKPRLREARSYNVSYQTKSHDDTNKQTIV